MSRVGSGASTVKLRRAILPPSNGVRFMPILPCSEGHANVPLTCPPTGDYNYFAMVQDGGPPPIPLAELEASSRATLRAARSLTSGRPEPL